jgi:L-rhamnose mutarotase
MDPEEYLKMQEKVWAGLDNLIKAGEIKEFGYFADGRSGYALGEAETTDVFRDVSTFLPFYEADVHEIIPYEKGKVTIRDVIELRRLMK